MNSFYLVTEEEVHASSAEMCVTAMSEAATNTDLPETPTTGGSARKRHSRLFCAFPNDVKTPDIMRTTPRTQAALRMFRNRTKQQQQKIASLQQQVRRAKKRIRTLEEMLANLHRRNLISLDEQEQLTV